jgi:hypothetical protein
VSWPDDEVGQVVAVYVGHDHLDASCSQFKLGVAGPVPTLGSSGPSSLPFEGTTSNRPLRFTSPHPMPWPNGFLATTSSTHSSWLVGKSLVRGLSNTRDVKSRRVDLVL